MFILARILWKKTTTLDYDTINGTATVITSYKYKGITYFTKIEEIYNIKKYTWVDFKWMRFDTLNVKESATKIKREWF